MCGVVLTATAQFSLVYFCPGSCDAELRLALLSRLLNSRNDAVDPCEDFYKYACGNWKSNHSSRTTEESRNVFDILLEENELVLKRLLGRERWLLCYFQHLPESELRIFIPESTIIPIGE